jgi:dihydropteroate synthase
VDIHSRDTATLAASVAAALAGAHIVRVHSVRPTVEALAIADAILHAEDQENHEGAPF